MKGTLVVSLDFELHWGMHECYSLSEYGENIRGVRPAIPALLRLFEKYQIHATWASVGLLFSNNVAELRSFVPAQLPTYRDTTLSPYPLLARLQDGDIHYFAPELLEQIISTPGQEIGSHTFSHFYCREAGQTLEQFRLDMESAKAIGASRGYTVQSVVYPRNQSQPDYNRILKDLGFTSYRAEEDDWIHKRIKTRRLLRILRLADVYLPLTGHGCFTPENEGGIVNIKGSRMYKPKFIKFLEPLKLRRIKKQMLYAAKHGKCFHLWWHPHNVGIHTEYHLQQLEEIFSYYRKLQDTYGMRSMTMSELADEVLHS